MTTLTSVEIRHATLRDAKTIAEIHAVTLQAAYKGIVPDDVLKAATVERRVAQWREAIEYCEPQVQVVMDEGKVVGFVGFDRSRDPNSRPTNGEIWALYVLPSHWDRGIGLALWDAAREGLAEEGCTHVTAWVPMRNERAMRFMELAGFKREMNTARVTQFGTIKLEEVRLKRADLN